MYSIEWDDGFGGTASSRWTDDKVFITGLCEYLQKANKTGIKIVQKIDVTGEFIGGMYDETI
ncbi:hypothetical protein X915_gp049 [Bacillus phage vB_BanS-Tsamsa]|uniref:Uncharacterized protein n=1 Tax=Bacillus phage vB_BanS-Tsamsa TaxID=1308863 RepID=U5JA03_9CAUD|nr:hypothetical protein X915_gp049 [Bacillus phage vB_BanS-Tsamsa]AGI11950.1 hypothetical protein [Bacillus phage vB_BanS-Tsamsa]